MRKGKRRHSCGRLTAVVLLIGIQLFVLLTAVIRFTELYPYYRILSGTASVFLLLHVIHCTDGMAYRLAWTAVILLFPISGGAVYLMFSGNRLSRDSRERMRRIREAKPVPIPDDPGTHTKAAAYLRNSGGYPQYTGTDAVYYPSGEAFFAALLQELEQARQQIYLEYFILSEGEMWDAIHGILRKKASEGVDVRLICDDLGSIRRLSGGFSRKLRKEGIRCSFFHRFVPVLSALQNNRDHRKICVIDGVTAFTGGINIGDEYINRTSPFGYWKDCAVKISGEAAVSFAVMFLTMWDYITGETGPMPAKPQGYTEAAGTVQPFFDGPAESDPAAENLYLQLMAEAEDSVWIMTPYLIPDETMERALIRAAKRGADVRIVTPGIPDKKIVYEATRSHYPSLLSAGVRIYEYSPGFLHAKTLLTDRKTAVIGSMNLDYRSFCLHFECGVCLTDTAVSEDLYRDFLRTFEVSREIQPRKTGLLRSLYRSVLDLLSPLF